MTFTEAIDYLLDEYNLSDRGYDVRERADHSDRPEGENSWDHPDCLRFGEAFQAIKAGRESMKADPGREIPEAEVSFESFVSLEKKVANLLSRLSDLEIWREG